MSLSRLLVYTVTVLRPVTTTDPYGNTVTDWGSATQTTYPAWLEQQSGKEATDDSRSAAVSEWLLILPVGADIKHGDRVQHETTVYEVIAPPNTFRALSGPHHIEAQLRTVQP